MLQLILSLLAVVAVVLVLIATTSKAWGYVRGARVELQLADIGGGMRMRVDAAQAFTKMRAQAYDVDGVVLKVNRAFATWEEQEKLYALYKAGAGNLAAEPGYSNHQGGIAVDIESAGGTNAAFQWLTSNGQAFGFRRTVATEPWHWEFRV